MSRHRLAGIDGSNPLGFLAALGLLRICSYATDRARLGFSDDGTCCAFIEGVDRDLADLVASDAAESRSERDWWITYAKTSKKGERTVADLKAPPDVFALYLARCVAAWLSGDVEAAGYIAAFGTSEARAQNGSTKPTAFHFTGGNQEFLKQVEDLRAKVDRDWVVHALTGDEAVRSGPSLRWDPNAERNRALMSADPSREVTRVNAPLDWLAFRALPLFPSFPVSARARSKSAPAGRIRVATTAVRENPEAMSWPLWRLPLAIGTVRSILHLSWSHEASGRAHRGVFAVCRAEIRRGDYATFGPAQIST